MKPLFSAEGLRTVRKLASRKSLYAFDYDGTLCPIVPHTEEAVIPPRTTRLLEEFSRIAPVAVISGRRLRDLRDRFPFRVDYLVGNHGAEGLGEAKSDLIRAARICRRWRKALKVFDFEPGVEVEHKLYSLSIHYRRVPRWRATEKRIEEAVSTLKPRPRVIRGKAVVNLVPKGLPNKGAALKKLRARERAKSVFFIGDDFTDEDVFRIRDSRFLGVRVGKSKSSAADFFIRGQPQIDRILRLLIKTKRSGRRA